jgi:hypothetical protein
MIDAETLARMNGKYVCPPDAGPAWIQAAEAGEDMSLIEENLRLSPWQRLLNNNRDLALLRGIQNARAAKNGTSH